MVSTAAWAVPSATDPAVVGLTAERFDQIYGLIQGLGTVFAVGLGIVILGLAWLAVMGSRS